MRARLPVAGKMGLVRPFHVVFALAEDAHRFARAQLAHAGHGGIHAGGALAARDGRSQIADGLAHPSLAEEMLAGHKVHLVPGEGDRQKQRVKIGDVVGNDQHRLAGMVDLVSEGEQPAQPRRDQHAQNEPYQSEPFSFVHRVNLLYQVLLSYRIRRNPASSQWHRNAKNSLPSFWLRRDKRCDTI